MRFSHSMTALLLVFGQAAAAQDGAYYGLGLALNQTESSAAIVPTTELSSTDPALALTVGYRWPMASTMFVGVEGNLDFQSGDTMTDGVATGCTSITPSWCEVDSIARLRLTLGKDFANGNSLMGSLGVVAARGRLEANPGDYVDAVGKGTSLGLAWQHAFGERSVRFDLNYDHINSDDARTYDRSLDIVGLRVSLMF